MSARQSLDRAGSREHRITLAGRTVCLRFAGEALEPVLWPALAHHVSAPEAGPALELLVWDSDSTGIEPPPAPWEGMGFADWSRTQARRMHDIEMHLCGHGTFSLLMRQSATASYWVRSAADVPPWDRAAPFRSLLGMWAEQHGAMLVHGAAIGNGDGALLLTAPGGSGKSTAAVASLLHGLCFLGEDYVLVEPGEPPCVHNLYGTAKLDDAAMARLFVDGMPPGATLDPGPDPVAYDHHKTILLLGETHRAQLARSLDVRAILVPFLSPSRETSVTPLGAAAVLRALAPTTLLQLPGSGPHSLAMLAAIAASVPGHALALGRDPGAVVSALQRLLEGS